MTNKPATSSDHLMIFLIRTIYPGLLFVRRTNLCTLYQETLRLSKATSTKSKQQPRWASSTWDRVLQPQPKNGLTRESIVAAGIALADEEGLEAVSIRRIAAQLGSSPMALYHYVPSKSDLLNLILDALSAEFEWPAKRFRDWRSTLSHFAGETRRSLERHPWASALRAADPEYGPVCIRNVELLLTALSEFGLDTRTATRSLGVLFVFVNGFVAAESVAAGRRGPKGQQRATHQPRFSRAILASGDFPHVDRVVEMSAELPDDDGFERALNWILDGIEADLAAKAGTQAAKRRPANQRRTA
jgi:AcrR family transcriptional regulator